MILLHVLKLLESILGELLGLHLLILEVEIVHRIVIRGEKLSLVIVILILSKVIDTLLPDLVVGEGPFLRNSKNVVIIFLRNSFEEVNFANFEKELQSKQGI